MAMPSGVVPHTAANPTPVASRASVAAATQSSGRAANVLAGFLRPGDKAFVERAANGPIFKVAPGLLVSAIYFNRQPGEFDEDAPFTSAVLEEALREHAAMGHGNSSTARALKYALANLKAQFEPASTLDVML